MTKKLKAELSLLFVAILWGSTFALTKNALETLAPFNFLAIRFTIAFLMCVIIFYKKVILIDKSTLKYGSILGIILFSSFVCQTYGIKLSTPAKAGFITGFSVVIVPIIVAILAKQLPDIKNIIGVFLALIGLTLLSLNSLSGVNIGDIITLIGAFGFAMQIIVVGKYTHKVDSINLAIIQIGIVSILSIISTFVLETPTIPTGSSTWVAILVTSLLATCVSFVIQTTMQQYTSPSTTALIYTGEPVFGAIFAYLLAGEILTSTSILGCIAILLGMVISEVNFKSIFNKPNFNCLDLNNELE
ncbi:Permease of the drug/metabolite transporter (DMT) superfamily [Clostridium cavendishii DSM 21758]|uniref:Permease of the drug/metabolite transporter (DMT) superfamily n=1 Tax=Clostridium cavendishii DSM 21758 TaxID=1121302 RepID=A0A1M6VSN4_9CLOT|nr:DMT family transporter [Clostridium cavendishii]SHK84439.1 Permease of the drug/metabolite transporter (DMT) superfamily [Clostridium cavendishii DSM 21758]